MHKDTYLPKDFIAAIAPNGEKEIRVHLNILQPRRLAKKFGIYLVSGIQSSNQKGKMKKEKPKPNKYRTPKTFRTYFSVKQMQVACIYPKKMQSVGFYVICTLGFI